MNKNKKKTLKKRKWPKKRIFVIVVGIPILFLYFFGRFLVVNQSPVKSDVLILLSGDVGRLEKSTSLINEGYADRMIVTRTNGRGFGEISLESVIQAGIKPSMIIPDYKATSTYTNAIFSKELMIENGLKSALVVSSNYHMRRVKYTFDKIYKGTGIKLTYVAAPSINFDPTSWWSQKRYVRTAISEYIKLAGYIIKY
jgi:uncharacterized SAM-binding protein YcdF (DUF218 family)